MTIPRLTIRTLMTVVIVIAMNLAVGRALISADNPMLEALLIPSVMLQLALWRWIRTKDRARSFWAAFLVSGAVVTGSFLWGILTPSIIGIGLTTNPTTGGVTSTRLEVPGSLMWRVWDRYARLVANQLERWPEVARMLYDDENPVLFFSAFSLIAFVPQLLIPLACGSVTCWIAERMARRSRRFERAAANPA